MKRRKKGHQNAATAIVEFTITATFFLMMIMAIISRWSFAFYHNALVESTAARRALRRNPG